MSNTPDEGDRTEVDGQLAGGESMADQSVVGETLGDALGVTGDVGSSSGAGGSSGGSSTTGAGGGGVAAKRSVATDSRRVAPKWLGKKIGRFRLQGLLGAGAVGRVFRAEDAILHRRVALKVIAIHTENGQINRNADQFLTEARAAATLEHPHVVQIYEAGEAGNLCYIAMELLEGGSLKELVEAGGPMDPGRACLLIADAADALAAGHQAGITHRDIKPANLMLSRQGRCKVTDFGLATFGDLGSVPKERAAGTPLFAAPEVIRGTSADERSDIYSLGATLYYLLAGRPPYKARTRSEVLRMHVEEPIPDLRQVRPGLPESLVAAVEKSLDKDPGQRFSSAQQFARVLRVQTIPAGPMPSVSDSAATLVGLSGITAASGTGGMRPSASGPLTAGDLAAAGRPRAIPTTPPPSAEPAVVGYKSPAPPAVPPWWRSPLVLTSAAAAVLLVLLIGLMLGRTSAPAGIPYSATPTRPPSPSVTPTPPAATTPPAAAVVEVPAAVVPAPPAAKPPALEPTAAELQPVQVTDVDHLTRIANGNDPDRPNRIVTVVGKVAKTRLSAGGRTVRIEFDGTPFWIAYWATNKVIFNHMADRFGETAGTLVGKTIRVTEKVQLYNGLPEVILTATDHVKVEPEANAADRD